MNSKQMFLDEQISILWFVKDHVTLIMMLEIQICITWTVILNNIYI